MEEPLDAETLVSGLLSENESVRKFAVFKLQGLLGDPSFADAFVQSRDGLLALRRAVLEATGNTQAYALGSLNKLLELDMGWEMTDSWVVEMAVSLATTQPLVNIVRNALTLLVLVVSRPLHTVPRGAVAPVSGFSALKPALEKHPGFLAALVARLSASDHGLCANALRLVNALMRDAIANGGEHEWPRFIKRLQDLGVIRGVGMLMRGEAATDAGSSLAAAILEFQSLTKSLLRKWRGVRVNLELHEHKKALKTVHLLSRPEPYRPTAPNSPPSSSGGVGTSKPQRKHHPEKWRRLGFETESPASEFDDTGYLGMMDLVEYARRNEDTYAKLFMEQAVQPRGQRCPIARASLAVTLVLFEHFEIDEQTESVGGTLDGGAASEDDYIMNDVRRPSETNVLLQQRVLDARANGHLDRLYRPLLLQWARLHTAALNAFVRLWKLAGADVDHDDFARIEELVRVVVEQVVGAASRKLEVGRVEDQLRGVSLDTARKWQMLALEEIYADAWGPHLVPVREQLHHESLQFMKEQRVRCLLQGSWFPVLSGGNGGVGGQGWRFARLSPTRRWLHYGDFTTKGADMPAVETLEMKIDLNTVTSVDSHVSAATGQTVTDNGVVTNGNGNANQAVAASTSTLKVDTTNGIPNGGAHSPTITSRLEEVPSNTSIGNNNTTTTKKVISVAATASASAGPITKITIIGNPTPHDLTESPLLTLHATDPSVASEWLDGLLMLLNQAPITKETTRVVALLEDWGVRLRMLNLRWEDVDWEDLEMSSKGAGGGGAGLGQRRPVPSREGTEEEYWYGLPDAT